MSRLFVAVVIPTGSEERKFPACLRRLGRFERVVLVDSGATVRTCELARTAGPVVVQFQWDGRFPKKRNWFLRTHCISTSWVLFLEADEFGDDAFCDELARTLPDNPARGFLAELRQLVPRVPTAPP